MRIVVEQDAATGPNAPNPADAPRELYVATAYFEDEAYHEHAHVIGAFSSADRAEQAAAEFRCKINDLREALPGELRMIQVATVLPDFVAQDETAAFDASDAAPVFTLWHCSVRREAGAYRDDELLLGVFSTRERAVAAFRSLASHPRFARWPDLIDDRPSFESEGGFVIEEDRLDEVGWPEGFTTTFTC